MDTQTKTPREREYFYFQNFSSVNLKIKRKITIPCLHFFSLQYHNTTILEVEAAPCDKHKNPNVILKEAKEHTVFPSLQIGRK